MTKIIAELGTLNLTKQASLMRATSKAFDAGADMVKVQLIKAQSAWWASERQRARYKSLEWEVEEWSEYFQACRKRFEKPVFASIFDTSYLVDEITNYLPLFKLGWKANMMPELIELVFEYGKPVIWSLNGNEYWRQGLRVDPRPGENEAVIARRIYALSRSILTTRLYVQTLYPTREEDIIIPDFGAEYHGLSAHYANHDALKSVIKKRPKVLEIHVKTGDSKGPDTAFAQTLEQLRNLVEYSNTLALTKCKTSSAPSTWVIA